MPGLLTSDQSVRRASPPPMLRTAPFPVPAAGVVGTGSSGLIIESRPAPEGVTFADSTALRLVRGAPHPVEQLVIVKGGELAVSVAGSVARSLQLPNLVQVFDRRPPGTVGVVAGALANACCLVRADGWSAVVLPSLGDIAPGQGSGALAMRPDGLRVAFASDEAIMEYDLTRKGALAATHVGGAAAVAFDRNERLICAAGAGLGEPGAAPVAGSSIVALAAAAQAPVAVARHEDGSLSVWDTDSLTEVGRFTSPIVEAALAIASDGSRVGLSSPGAVAMHRLPDGAATQYIENANAIVPFPLGPGFVVGGAWGSAFAGPVEDPA
jgi:hypothetical protein